MNFDPIANYYDTLARIVFWGAIRESQQTHLKNHISRQSKVLIVGGGTGWILNHIPFECTSVTYVEPSGNMMEISRRRSVDFPVKFIQAPIEKTDLQTEFNIIITNFFFDQFDEIKGRGIAQKLKEILTDNGTWIFTDFENKGKWWHNLLLKLMYSFFTRTAGLQTNQLPDWRDIMDSIGMRQQRLHSYYGDFIISVCYGKYKSTI